MELHLMGASPSGKKGSLSSVNASCHICARWIQAQTKSDVPLLGDEKSISHPPAGYLGTTVRAELHRSAQLASANDCQKMTCAGTPSGSGTDDRAVGHMGGTRRRSR